MKDKTIIFDLDGTLYAMSPIFKPLLTVLSAPNFFYVPKYMKVREKYRGAEFEHRDILKNTIAKDLEDVTGCKDGNKWINSIFYGAFIKTLSFLRNRKEINNLFKGLKNKGYKIAVISDFSKVKERLVSLNIDISLIDFMTSSEEEGAFKPNIKVFERLLKELNVDSDNLIFVGDRDDTDGVAAKKLGARFIKVNGKNNSNWLDVIRDIESLS